MAIQVLGVHRDGAMCERILVPGQNLYPADGLSREEAAGVEFLAIGAHAVRRSLGEPRSPHARRRRRADWARHGALRAHRRL